MKQVFFGILGFSAGFIVAGGVVALMIGLGILTRFIGVTHTADRIALYEDAVFAGAAVGTVATTFDIGTGGILPGIVSSALLVMSGLFMGMVVGGWIMALAEIINVFPVFCRRFGIVKGMSWIVIALAAGKVTGSLYHFYMRWGKG
jgi:stage V sporulation protein AB